MSTELQARSDIPVDSLSTDMTQRRVIAAIAAVLLTFVAFWPTTASLMVEWEDTVGRTYTHGYLVVALGLWMIWRDRASWAAGAAEPSLAGFGLLVAGSVCWLAAYRAGLQIVHQAAIPALVACALLAMFGWSKLRGLKFPLAWLYLAIPIWDALLPLLNAISVGAVRVLLRLADVPAYFVNNKFELPLGTFEIADGCSGLHFFVVALTVSLLYGEVNRDSLRTRVKLVAFALLLAMATNWLRIFVIVLVGHLTDMQHSLVAGEHYTFGWYMFAGMMVLYFLVVRRWPAAVVAPRDPPAVTGPAVPSKGALAAAFGLALAPVTLLLDGNRASDADVALAMRADVRLETPPESASQWQPKFPAATREARGLLYADGIAAEVYVAGFSAQQQGAELVGYRVSLLGEHLRRGSHAAPAPAPWTETVAFDSDGRTVIWHSYRLDDRWYKNPLRMQVDYGLGSLLGAPGSALIAIRVRCAAADCDAARISLQTIVKTYYP